MTTSYFYLQSEVNAKNKDVFDALEKFSEDNFIQIYVLDSPISDRKYAYEYNDACIILIPNFKLLFFDYGKNKKLFEEYIDDFIEDLGSLSDKYRYREVIGRPRHWRRELIDSAGIEQYEGDVSTFLNQFQIADVEKKRQCELLISLLTGSINDIDRIKGGVPSSLLDKVKHKILLFDGDQTRFVYQTIKDKKKITIQGLSGTGKTELLLHKLKELYVGDEKSKIIFTCHNRILADHMRKRIPEFFTFLRVEQQIEWIDRLFCVHAWGSPRYMNSGAYSYICNYYEIPCFPYSRKHDFSSVCQLALDEIRQLQDRTYAFDYMFIDESQDFPDAFLQLCELVTEKNVYIAGDIFQSIFEDSNVKEISPDYLLSKVYRTDPRTLMLAHGLGMGLFEENKLRWLKDDEWRACGYSVQRSDDNDEYILSRKPLRRFEDLMQEGYESFELVRASIDTQLDMEAKVIELMKKITNENATVSADDIAIIFIDSRNYIYEVADRLEISVPREFGWEVTKAYETKENEQGKLFVSNRNNVKGLEFPFVICVTKSINSSRFYRNALYMLLTRSFLKSYLLISEDSNPELLSSLEQRVEEINQSGLMRIHSPPKDQINSLELKIQAGSGNISYRDFVYSIMEELEVLPIFYDRIYRTVQLTIGDEFDEDKIREVVEFNYAKMSGG